MITFENGGAEVVFDIVSSAASDRRKVRMSLDDFLVIVKTTTTLEELRVEVFSQIDRKTAAAA